MKRDNKIKHLKRKILHIEHINKNIVSDKNFKTTNLHVLYKFQKFDYEISRIAKDIAGFSHKNLVYKKV